MYNHHQPLLTVIVPCYNVEKYMDKCILSIVNQTYTNLEILLINDGSTDQTGFLCDAWQTKDPRIRVIHKQNEGSSYARKIGVEHATGEYVTFVDADDWIDENMYINMMTALLSTHSDIAQCGVCDVYEEDSSPPPLQRKGEQQEVVGRVEGVLLIIESKQWQSYMWNKIYKKHLFDHVEFPKGRGLSEDTTIAHILFHHALQSVYLRDEYYFYYQRSGSTTNSNNIIASKMKNWYDTYHAFYERYCFVEQHPEYHSCLILSKNNAVFRGIRALRNSMIYPQYFPKNYSTSLIEQLKTIGFTRKDIIKELITPIMSVEISVFLLSPACYKMIILLYSKIRLLFLKNHN